MLWLCPGCLPTSWGPQSSSAIPKSSRGPGSLAVRPCTSRPLASGDAGAQLAAVRTRTGMFAERGSSKLTSPGLVDLSVCKGTSQFTLPREQSLKLQEE